MPADIYTTVGGSVKDNSTISIYTATKGNVVRLIEKSVVLSAASPKAQGDGMVIALTPAEADAIFKAIGNKDIWRFICSNLRE